MQQLSKVPGILPRESNTNTKFLRVNEDGELEPAEHAGQVLCNFDRNHFLYFSGQRGKFAVGDALVADRWTRIAVPFRSLPDVMRDQIDGGLTAFCDEDKRQQFINDAQTDPTCGCES